MSKRYPITKAPPSAGFTLLEMAIVVLIIGLLVGGIVATKGFLAQAELRSLMTESNIMIDAFNQFKNRYRSLPGDYNQASASWPSGINGDGNGLIRAALVAGVSTPNNAELFAVFQHLALAGYIKGNYTGVADGGAPDAMDIGVNVPQSVMAGAGYLFTHPDQLDGVVAGDPVYFDGRYGHILRVGGYAPVVTVLTDRPKSGFLVPRDAYAIDSKFDDGTAGTGWITTYANPVGTSACALTSAPSSPYSINMALGATNMKPCYLFLNIPGS